MVFSDYTYFKADIKLSGADISGDYSQDFDDFIEQYEDKILTDLLGYDLKNAFITGLDEVAPLQKWLDLRDGKVYQVKDSEGRLVNVKWNGFLNAEKRSCLAYFIYYEYQKARYTRHTTSGENKQNGQNSERASITDFNIKLRNAYNLGLDLYGFDIETLTGKNAILRSKRIQYELLQNRATLTDYYKELLKPTAYNFIYAMNELNASTYPNWNFTIKEKLNYLGI